MTSPNPLKGTDLVDCARANAKQGVETTAKLSGYGEDINTFMEELEKACQNMGIKVDDIIIQGSSPLETEGRVIAPETATEL